MTKQEILETLRKILDKTHATKERYALLMACDLIAMDIYDEAAKTKKHAL